MPKRLNRWQRCRQILAWAKTEFPIPPETELRVAKKLLYKGQECAGLTWRERGKMKIALSSTVLPNLTCARMVLFHEIGHSILYDDGLGMAEGPKVREMAGQVEDAYEHHGFSDAESFPTE